MKSCLNLFIFWQRQEFKWLIKNEVQKVFNQLKEILEAGARRYPVEIWENESQTRQEKYIMSTSTQTSQDQLKCVLTITGDSITSAVNLNFVRIWFKSLIISLNRTWLWSSTNIRMLCIIQSLAQTRPGDCNKYKIQAITYVWPSPS